MCHPIPRSIGIQHGTGGCTHTYRTAQAEPPERLLLSSKPPPPPIPIHPHRPPRSAHRHATPLTRFITSLQLQLLRADTTAAQRPQTSGNKQLPPTPSPRPAPKLRFEDAGGGGRGFPRRGDRELSGHLDPSAAGIVEEPGRSGLGEWLSEWVRRRWGGSSWFTWKATSTAASTARPTSASPATSSPRSVAAPPPPRVCLSALPEFAS